MDIVYAAEKPTIARLLSEYMKRRVRPEDIDLTENPNETGSFFIGFDMERYELAPNGRIRTKTFELLD